MTLVTIRDVEYDIGKLDAMIQIHVVVKIAPVVVEVREVMRGFAAALSSPDGKMPDGFDPMVGMSQFASALAKMPGADLEYVINAFLNVTKRKSGTGWAPVIGPNGIRMFPDMTGLDLTAIAGHGIWANLQNFMPGNPQPSPARIPESPLPSSRPG
jgi:hypothetical protein